jgi:chaperone modulatory protein CbpM
MPRDELIVTHARVLDERVTLDLGELCRVQGVHQRVVIGMVREGVLEPLGDAPENWRFAPNAMARLARALRIRDDLHLNLAGTALALDLLEELAALRQRVSVLEALLDESPAPGRRRR